MKNHQPRIELVRAVIPILLSVLWIAGVTGCRSSSGSVGIFENCSDVGMESHPNTSTELLGPEVQGLRVGLNIQSQYVKGKDSYTVRIRIVNTSNEPITLIGFAPYHGKLNTYDEWLRAKVIFMTFPELIPPSAQTFGSTRTSPPPITTIRPGKEFAISWESYGRYLKADYYYQTTPYFPSDGLYGVRARIIVRTANGNQIQLYSNEQGVSVGGTVALPKHGVAHIVQRDEEKQEVVLSLGSRHRIVKGDRFHISRSLLFGWMMTVDEVDTSRCRASVWIRGDSKNMELLPPKHAKAQLWEFGQAGILSQPPVAPKLTAIIRDLSAGEPKAIRVGMTRKELHEICHPDGGISAVTHERYVLNKQPPDAPEGMVLKVYVSLRPAGLSKEVYLDAERFRKWQREHIPASLRYRCCNESIRSLPGTSLLRLMAAAGPSAAGYAVFGGVTVCPRFMSGRTIRSMGRGPSLLRRLAPVVA